MQSANDLMNRLTLLCPTFERPNFAYRQMMLAADAPYRLIVLDGSKCPLTDWKNSSKGNVEYIHIPNSSLEDRMQMIGDLVFTDYVHHVSDDDVFLPIFAPKAIEILDSDKSLNSVYGRFFSMKTEGNEVALQDKYLGSRGFDLTQESATQRLKAMKRNYQIRRLFSVNRTPDFAQAIQMAYTRPDFFAQAEITVELVMTVLGGAKYVPMNHYVRSQEAQPVREKYGTEPIDVTLNSLIIEKSPILDQWIERIWNQVEYRGAPDLSFKTFSECARNVNHASLLALRATRFYKLLFGERPWFRKSVAQVNPEIIDHLNYSDLICSEAFRALSRGDSLPNSRSTES